MAEWLKVSVIAAEPGICLVGGGNALGSWGPPDKKFANSWRLNGGKEGKTFSLFFPRPLINDSFSRT